MLIKQIGMARVISAGLGIIMLGAMLASCGGEAEKKEETGPPDPAPMVAVAPDTNLSEKDGGTTIEVRMNVDPGTDFIVEVGSSDANQLRVSTDGGATFGPAGLITFNSANWNMNHVVDIAVVHDGIIDGDHVVDITVAMQGETNPARIITKSINVADLTGIMMNEPQANLSGWTQCYASIYNTGGTDAIATILANCNQPNLMLACRPVGNPDFTLAAYAKRVDVTTDTTTDSITVHNANGVDWYFNTSKSWGFAPQGAGVNKSNCDYNDGTQLLPEQRMCVHTSGGLIGSGYRCGDNQVLNLNSNADWERVILQAP